MPVYRVLRAHRGRYGYVRAGVTLHLPSHYADDLMRHKRPLVAELSPEEAARIRDDAAPGASPAGVGESQAGPATAVLPAAGSGKPLSSQHLGRRSRRKTSTTAGVAPE